MSDTILGKSESGAALLRSFGKGFVQDSRRKNIQQPPPQRLWTGLLKAIRVFSWTERCFINIDLPEPGFPEIQNKGSAV